MNRSQRGKWLVLPVALIALLILPCALAQETTAGLLGTVKDPSGASVVSAAVEVSGPALIGTKKAETDQVGYFRFANLPAGVYSLTVTASGFRTFKQEGINLEVGHLPSIEVHLEVGAMTETVEVSAQHQPDEPAHPEYVLPERHPIRCRRPFRTAAKQHHRRQFRQ